VSTISLHSPISDDGFRTGWRTEKGNFSRCAALMCQQYWTPHVFKDGERRADKWHSSDWIVVGWGRGEFPIRAARDATHGCAHVLGLYKDGSMLLMLALKTTVTDLREYRAIRAQILRDVPQERPIVDTPAFYEPLFGVESYAGRSLDQRSLEG